MSSSRVLSTAVASLCATALVLPAAPAVAGSRDTPSPGAAGLGDRLFPRLGNGGYDALHYSVRLRYRTALPQQAIDGTVTMRARATQDLSRFDLDFSGDSVGPVAVNGEPARRWRSGGDLVIAPRHAIADGSTFSVTVRHFRSAPKIADSDNFLTTAFVRTPDGSVTAGQPGNMHQVFPCNDHPRDKAAFSVRFDVPTGETAVANGVLIGRHRHGARTVWTYQQAQPMATELTQWAVGRFTVVGRKPVGAVRVRDVVPTRLLASYRRKLGVERTQLRWMEQRVGAYPFRSYGSLIVVADLGFALETQTLSLYDSTIFGLPRGVWSPVMLHELSHQWFGDNVAPWSWSDVWLNEGHASWYEFSYAASHHDLREDEGATSTTELMHELYQAADLYRSLFGPVARPRSGSGDDLFNPNVYGGGALVLYALREKVGGATFRRIERIWVQRYAGRSASTASFIALASEVSGQDLVGFLHPWLYSRRTPPMPGHPSWSVAPVDSRRAAATERQLTQPRGTTPR